MSEDAQADFYNAVLNSIADSNSLNVQGNVSGDRWVFSNPETGRIALNVNIWQWWDDLRSNLGEDEAYLTVMGI